MKLTHLDLVQRQSLPLEAKVWHTQKVIREWYDINGGHVYVSFSGGLDSVVLRHIVLDLFRDIECVFVNTGNEYPEIVKFVRSFGDVTFVRPLESFESVLRTRGYPLFYKQASQYINDIRSIGKDTNTYKKRLAKKGLGSLPHVFRFLIDAPFPISADCCEVLKKNPAERYERKTKNKPLVGVKASDSHARLRDYLLTGCNDTTRNRQISKPLSIWLRSDIIQYISEMGLDTCSIYKKGYSHTGCVLCGFGCMHCDYPNNFQLLQITHPKFWLYGMDHLGYRDVLSFAGIPFELEDYRTAMFRNWTGLYRVMDEDDIFFAKEKVKKIESLLQEVE